VRRMLVAFALTLLAATAAAQEHGWCSTPSPPPDKRDWFTQFASRAKLLPHPKTGYPIPIAFHVITDGRNGKLTTQQVTALVNNLNWAYRDSPLSFRLYSIDTTKNAAWYNNCYFNAKNQQKLRKRLAKDTRYYINVYSCHLGLPNGYGISNFPPGYPIPGNPGTTYMQGVAIDPITVGGSELFQYGLAMTHEIGHYLGLFHTFESAFNPGQEPCTDPGDFVSDTPTQAGNTLGDCPIGRNSCPALSGLDDIPNFMNYATDACWDHFSPEQAEVMVEALQEFRPTLGTR
jgi:hypothetical protein